MKAREMKIGGIIIPSGIRAEYDFTRQHNDDGGRKRRQARIETGPEESILRPYNRRQAVNLARDMVRNNPQSRGLTKTLRTNIVGDYGKLIFNNTGDWYTNAQKWFNDTWSHAADFRDNSTFRECLQLVVYALTHEGDFVAVFDDGIITGGIGTGKLLFFEADQICNLDVNDFAPFKANGFRQDSGIIYDRYGRIVGVIVSHKRGVESVMLSECWVLTQDPDSRDLPSWRFVRRKFRLIQSRGSADAIPAMQTTIDGYEILGYEMQTAKKACARYASVIEPEDDESGVTPTGFADLEIDGETVDPNQTPEEDEDEISAERLEHYTGGNTDYLPKGSQVIFDPTNRPNANLSTFLDYTNDLSGGAHGMAHAYARGRADTSYTAFRGDMVMTWMTFKDFQQFLEDDFSDWAGVKAIKWGIANGEVDPPPVNEQWESATAWQYPTMPAVDEQKEQGALTQKFKNGQTTFRKTLGPQWKEILTQYSEEIEFARGLKLPLSIFETVAGAPAGGNNNAVQE